VTTTTEPEQTAGNEDRYRRAVLENIPPANPGTVTTAT
jgi:hypothetical protein